MVLNGRRLLLGAILILAVALSLLALNRIITEKPAEEVPAAGILLPSESRSSGAGSYFAEHRLVRERNRSRQVELLEKIVNNERMDSQNKARAARDLIGLTEVSEKERLAEETVKALGYQDCVVLIRESAALVVVAGNDLTKDKEQLLAEQIGEILNLKADKITVMARPTGKEAS